MIIYFSIVLTLFTFGVSTTTVVFFTGVDTTLLILVIFLGVVKSSFLLRYEPSFDAALRTSLASVAFLDEAASALVALAHCWHRYSPLPFRSVWGDSKCHPKRLAQNIYTRLIPTPYFSLQRLSAESVSPLLKGRPTVCTWRHIAQMTFKGRPEGHRGAKWHAFLILEKNEKCTVPGGRPHGCVIGQMDQDGNPDGLATCNIVFKQAVCVGLNTDIFHIYAIQCKITWASCWCAIHEWVDLIWHILWQLMTCATFLLRKPPRDSSGFWIWPSLRSERKSSKRVRFESD